MPYVEGLGWVTERAYKPPTDTQRDTRYRKVYGITLAEARDFLKKENGTCPICLAPLSEDFDRQTQLEHCHQTGRVRGCVCLRCNLALGWVQDDPTRLERIKTYLETR